MPATRRRSRPRGSTGSISRRFPPTRREHLLYATLRRARAEVTVSSDAQEPARLLIRDLAQVATPGGDAAPLRGAALRAVSVTEDAFVLCEDGRISAVGEMRN